MSHRILVVDDQESILFFLRKTLEAEGHEVVAANTCAQARAALSHGRFDLVLLDLKLPDGSGLDLLEETRRSLPQTLVVMMTAFGDVETSVNAMKLGAFDYVNKPIRLENLLEILDRGFARRAVTPAPTGDDAGDLFESSPDIVPSRSPKMRELYELIRCLGVSDATTCLIQGESGAGKESVAMLLHRNSPRRDHALLEINCASIPETLLESELFGHERGAFTDAIHDKIGLLELAHRGTLLLDEIGEMSMSVQVKLLRVLEKMSFRRVGGIKDISVDVRIIAATNRDLRRAVAEGTFREDLFYRLNVMPIFIPSLRERPEDITVLAQHFLSLFSQRFGKSFERIGDAAARRLLDYGWPGNIRELKNVMERVAVLHDGRTLGADQIPLSPREESEEVDVIRRIERAITDTIPSDGLDFEEIVEELERSLIEKAFRAADGNQSQTAKLLNLNRDKLRYRMKNFSLL
jgi:two-component system, NtrC family, response regulator AtoC